MLTSQKKAAAWVSVEVWPWMLGITETFLAGLWMPCMIRWLRRLWKLRMAVVLFCMAVGGV